jgi:hypothetical protein
MGILAPVPSPVEPEGFTPSSKVTRTPRANPPLIGFPSESQSGLTEQAITFMRSYWQSVEESSDRVLPYLNSIYAPMVTYYGKLLSKEVVLRDKYYFLKNWPIRQTWEAESPTVSCNKAAAECEITGVRKYEAMNGGKHASGLVRYAYAIRFSQGSPHIVAEDSKRQ